MVSADIFSLGHNLSFRFESPYAIIKEKKNLNIVLMFLNKIVFINYVKIIKICFHYIRTFLLKVIVN